MSRVFQSVVSGIIVGLLTACGSGPLHSPSPELSAGPGASVAAAPQTTKSRWVPVAWSELPGFEDDALFEAWNAWLKGCEKPKPPFAGLCADVRRLSIGSPQEQRAWMMTHLQAYRVDAVEGAAEGLLTGYYEPALTGTRLPTAEYFAPLYRVPLDLAQRKPWYTRQEVDTLDAAKASLKGREIVYLSDPVDALVVQIQGSGRVRVLQPDGSSRMIRLAYAGSNEQPYKSVGRWLLDQGALRDASWPAIKSWIAQNPQRVNEMLWANPRMVFFKEEVLPESDIAIGPKGALGVPLTAGRSIAVDPASIPLGTPVWLVSEGNALKLQKLVFAQDTGSAIIGAVRADYFVGGGVVAGEVAGKLRQNLRLWALWPK